MDDTLRLESLKEADEFMRNLRFDVTPELLFKPRFLTLETREQAYKETHGFMFYIDALYEMSPRLMVMKTVECRSNSVGFVEDVPVELLEAAVNREGVRDECGMFPIDGALEGWLKDQLDLT